MGQTGMAETNKAALKLVMAGVSPMQSYGHVANVASQHEPHEMRKNLKRASQFGGTHSCLTSTLQWLFESNKDPYIALKVEQVVTWCKNWEEADLRKRKRVRRQWYRELAQIYKPKKPTNVKNV